MSSLIIGIDPDIEKSGVACLCDGNLELFSDSFSGLIQYLTTFKLQIKKVVIEAGWLNKSVWHLPTQLMKMSASQAHRVGAETGRRVGMNHATGQQIVEMCKSLGLVVQLVKPKSTKINAEQFKRITGFQGRTNQEVRDAGMLIWGMK